MLTRLAHFTYRRRRLVLVAWIVALVASDRTGEHRRRCVQRRLPPARLGEPGGVRPAGGEGLRQPQRLRRPGRRRRPKGVDQPAVRQPPRAAVRRHRAAGAGHRRRQPLRAGQRAPDLRGRHDRLRRDQPRRPRHQRLHHGGERHSRPVEGRRTSRARRSSWAASCSASRRSSRARSSASSRPSSSCSSRSARCWRWACRSSPRCSASARHRPRRAGAPTS